MAELNLSGTSATTVDVDALVIGVQPGPDGPHLSSDLDDGVASTLTSALRVLGATGKREEVTKLPSNGVCSAPLVVAVGLGPSGEHASAYDAETLRRCAGTAARALAGTRTVAVALPAPDADALGAVAEGALLGAYAFLRYRDVAAEDGDVRRPVDDLQLVTELSADGAARAAVDRARVTASAVTLVRDLVNTPASDLHPADLAETARATAGEAGLDIDVLDENALGKGGYGGIVGVGQGSVHPPRLARLAYTHPDARRTVAFVGKGITFDSGGLSLKPSASMETMKSDMGGAAAVLGAMSAIGNLRPEVNVVAYMALAENMPGGSAQRPSDVLRMYGGKTVEVMNTDAEGRLVMADAIVRAGEDADVIIDAATLTGGQITALGTRVSGVMGGDDDLRDAVVAAAGRGGDAVWPMPLPDELRKTLDSGVADIANVSGDRAASMLTAGVFLRDFVPDGVRWAHLDIAGPAFNEGEAYGYTPKGGTGAATRALIAFAEDVAAESLSRR